jgi:hypothetical protein
LDNAQQGAQDGDTDPAIGEAGLHIEPWTENHHKGRGQQRQQRDCQWEVWVNVSREERDGFRDRKVCGQRIRV